MSGTLFHAFKLVVGAVIPFASLVTGLRAATVDPLWLLKRPSLLLRSLLAILILVPVGATAFVESVGASPLIKTGIIVSVLAVGIGPPAILKRTRAATANVAYEVELDIVLMALAIVFVPVAVAVLGRYYGLALSLGAGQVAVLVSTRLIGPLLFGVVMARLAPRVAGPVARVGSPIVQIVLLLVMALAFVATWRGLLGLGVRGWLSCGAIALGALAIGHLCGGSDRSNRRVLAAFCVVRFPGLALLIASIAPLGKQVVPVVLAYAVCSVVIVGVYGAIASRRGRPAGRSIPRPAAGAIRSTVR